MPYSSPLHTSQKVSKFCIVAQPYDLGEISDWINKNVYEATYLKFDFSSPFWTQAEHQVKMSEKKET